MFDKTGYKLSKRNGRGAYCSELKFESKIALDQELVRKKLVPRYVMQTAEENYDSYIKRLETYISTLELR